jgi:hypothetical protein
VKKKDFADWDANVFALGGVFKLKAVVSDKRDQMDQWEVWEV